MNINGASENQCVNCGAWWRWQQNGHGALQKGAGNTHAARKGAAASPQNGKGAKGNNGAKNGAYGSKGRGDKSGSKSSQSQAAPTSVAPASAASAAPPAPQNANAAEQEQIVSIRESLRVVEDNLKTWRIAAPNAYATDQVKKLELERHELMKRLTLLKPPDMQVETLSKCLERKEEKVKKALARIDLAKTALAEAERDHQTCVEEHDVVHKELLLAEERANVHGLLEARPEKDSKLCLFQSLASELLPPAAKQAFDVFMGQQIPAQGAEMQVDTGAIMNNLPMRFCVYTGQPLQNAEVAASSPAPATPLQQRSPDGPPLSFGPVHSEQVPAVTPSLAPREIFHLGTPSARSSPATQRETLGNMPGNATPLEGGLRQRLFREDRGIGGGRGRTRTRSRSSGSEISSGVEDEQLQAMLSAQVRARSEAPRMRAFGRRHSKSLKKDGPRA